MIPPVVEVVLSIQVEPMKVASPEAYFGAFWASFRSDYPLSITQARIADGPEGVEGIPIFFVQHQKPSVRLQFVSEDDVWVRQIQADRLIVNWRSRNSVPYPRFRAVLEKIEKLWTSWQSFTSEFGLAEQAAKYCEITYVNKVETHSPLASLLPSISTKYVLEDFVTHLVFKTPSNSRLKAEIKRHDDGTLLVLFTQGSPVKSSEIATIKEQIQAVHDDINCFYEQLAEELKYGQHAD